LGNATGKNGGDHESRKLELERENPETQQRSEKRRIPIHNFVEKQFTRRSAGNTGRMDKAHDM
jgi:hypothetical protein